MSVEVAPYWNVNSNINVLDRKVTRVEVAPYWNVNFFLGSYYIPFESVEVAPYWNVNNPAYKPTTDTDIGRSSSILECKFNSLS